MTGGVALARRNSGGVGLLKMARTKVAELGFAPHEFTIVESPDGIRIKPNRYLKDDWRRVNGAFRSMGARWVRGGGCWKAEKCHISTKEAVAEVIPLLKVIYEEDTSMSEGISRWLDLGDKEAEWMKD
jgi:hypothetical protein